MNAVLKYIETHPNYGLFGLNTALCSPHGLMSINSTIGANGVLHLSRRHGKYDPDDDISNDTTLTVLDDTMKVVSMAPPIAPMLSENDINTLPIDDESPVMVSDLLIGKLVVVSSYKQTYVTSTRDTLHGNSYIAPNVPATTQDIFLDLMDRISPYSGIDSLFRSNRGGINCKGFSYSFVISPKSGKFTKNFLDYELFLVAVYDRLNHRFLNVVQLKSLVTQLNTGSTTYSICLPRYHRAYSVKQVKDISDMFTKKPYVRGVYLFDSSMNCASWIAPERKRINLERTLSKIVGAYLRNDYVGVMQQNNLNPLVYPAIHKFITTYKEEAKLAYKTAKMARTKRTFHNIVKGHKADTALYALYDGKINSVNELNKILTPSRAIRLMMEEYGAEYLENLIKLQETKRRKGEIGFEEEN